MRIFLIGNGPSLRVEDLDLITDEDSFGMNRIHLLYPKTKWRPTYFMWSDLPQRENDFEALISHIVSGEECYVRDDICELLLGKWRSSPKAWLASLPEWVHPWRFHLEHLCAAPGTPEWPKEWCVPEEEDVLCKLGTGMGPMMQQAVKLGYTELYLLGCDLNWHPLLHEGDSNHFSKEYEAHLEVHTQERADYNNELGRQMHELAYEWCKAHGIWVWNCTPGGTLEVYPRASLCDVLS